MTSDIGALLWKSADEMLGHLDRHDVSSEELVTASLDRIDAANPTLNFVCAQNREKSLAAARRSDASRRRGERRPLEGLPVAIKDITPTKGLPTAMGSRAYADWTPDRDAVVVERLCGAGAVIVAKSTTSEFASASVTESPLHGVTRNPWNLEHTCGGSSGGSAVAVATGCVPFAEGSDMGGSVRIPASFCGIVGLKPSLGRIPFGILPNLFDRLAHHGPLCRHVADAALFLSVTAGPDDRDPQSLPSGGPIPKPQGEIAGLRVGVSRDFGFQSVDPDVLRNFDAMLAAMEDRGALVEESGIAFSDDLLMAGQAMFSAGMAACYGHLAESRADDLDPTLLRFIELGRALDGLALVKADLTRTRHWECLRRAFEHFDVIVCPTMPRTAPRIGRGEFDFTGKDDAGRSVHFDMTMPFNLFGQLPAISIPSGLGDSGLPTGLQIVGRRFDERTILELAASLHDPARWTGLLRDLPSRPPSAGE